MLVTVGCCPKLAHLVLVTQTPRGPPLHSMAVVDERQLWPGGAVVADFEMSVGADVSVGNPLSSFPVVVGFGVGDSKSGGVPVGLGTQ